MPPFYLDKVDQPRLSASLLCRARFVGVDSEHLSWIEVCGFVAAADVNVAVQPLDADVVGGPAFGIGVFGFAQFLLDDVLEDRRCQRLFCASVTDILTDFHRIHVRE